MAGPQKPLTYQPEAAGDPDRALGEIAELEAALGTEIVRLRTDSTAHTGSTRGGAPVAALAGRPLWWWRAMLISWAHSPATRRAHSHDLLRGLSIALRDFEDGQLEVYLGSVQQALQQTA